MPSGREFPPDDFRACRKGFKLAAGNRARKRRHAAIGAGVKLVGIDYLSIERYGEPNHQTHHILLGNQVTVVEGLDLRQVSAGLYNIICLPLKLVNSDGAPARVLLQAKDH